MGFFSDLFTPSTTNNTTGTSNTNQSSTGQQSQQNAATSDQSTNQTQNQSTSGKTTSSSSQNAAGTNVVTQLDADTQAYLTKLLPSLFGNASAATSDNSNATKLKAISDALFSKASGGNSTDVKAAVDASTAKAKLDFETGAGAQVNQIAQAVGSKGNAYSKLIDKKAQNDLTTQIAQIAASGALQADSLNSADFSAAADAMVKASSVSANDQTAGLNPLLSVISLLKGANTTSNNTNTSTGQTGTTSEEDTLASLISAITGKTSGQSDTSQSGTLSQVGNTTGTEKGTSSKGIIGDILSIF